MATLISQIIVGALSLLGALHVYWAAGGRWAKTAAVPRIAGRPAFVPSAMITAIVALALFAAAALVGWAGGLADSPLPHKLVKPAAYALAVVLIARSIGDFRLVGFFKRASASRFARMDTALYAPACLALGLGTLYVAHVAT